MPFVSVDAKSDVDLDIFNAAEIAGNLPRELLVGHPCGAHAQEGSMGDGLGVGSDAVVLSCIEINIFRVEAGEHLLDQCKALIGGPVLDENLGKS